MTQGSGNLAALQQRHRDPAHPQSSRSRSFATDQPCSTGDTDSEHVQIIPPSQPPQVITSADNDWDLPLVDYPRNNEPELQRDEQQPRINAAPKSYPMDRRHPTEQSSKPPPDAIPPVMPANAEPVAMSLVEETPTQHRVFDDIGKGRNQVRTFDLGHLDMDAHLDRIESALSLGSGKAPAVPPPPAQASPLSDIDLLSEVASLGGGTTAEAAASDLADKIENIEWAELLDQSENDEQAAVLDSAPDTTAVKDATEIESSEVAPSPEPPVATDGFEHDAVNEGQMPLQILDLREAGMRLLAELHGLDPDMDAMLDGRDGWQAFEGLGAAKTMPALIKIVGLTGRILTSDELGDLTDAPVLISSDPKVGEALLIQQITDDGTWLAANSDNTMTRTTADAVIAALGATASLYIATLADSPVNAALSNLTGG